MSRNMGETLREILHNRGITPRELAGYMGVDLSRVMDVLEGREIFTLYFAQRLYIATGVPIEFWMERQRLYLKSMGPRPSIEAE
jgi:plasmid maintenance system antidote protein VapI